MKRSKSDGSYFVWSTLILLCMALAVFTLGFASCAAGGGGKEPSPPPSENTGEPYSEAPDSAPIDDDDVSPPDINDPENSQPVSTELGETEDMGQEYIDKFIFLGDSTTNGLAAYDIVPRSQVWTPSNGTLTISRWDIDKIVYPDDGTQLFITEAVAKKQPEYMLLTLGVNGVSFLDEEGFTLCYENIINAIQEASPNTKIILNSIYPVSVNYGEKSITNEKISAANGWIRNIAENKGVRFLNSASILLDENGALIESYHNGDYIHLSPDAYRLVIDYIRTHGYA